MDTSSIATVPRHLQSIKLNIRIPHIKGKKWLSPRSKKDGEMRGEKSKVSCLETYLAEWFLIAKEGRKNIGSRLLYELATVLQLSNHTSSQQKTKNSIKNHLTMPTEDIIISFFFFFKKETIFKIRIFNSWISDALI